MSESTRFALALDALDGVGRVTAGRLLRACPTYDALLRYPHEQILARIKGAPNAEALVVRLVDQDAMQPLFEKADATLARLAEKHVQVLSPGDSAWPARLQDLPRNQRPFLLYLFGHADVLDLPLVAFFARPPLSPASFEQAQALVRHLLPHGIAPATGAHPGFDVVIHKLSALNPTPSPSLLVAHCGLTKVPPPLRPTASAAVRAGGLLLSPFAMNHGPFDHDDRERALVLAALAAASVFVEPQPHTPAWHAMTWALDADRPVFGLAHPEHPLPDAVHPLQESIDFDWVLAAVRDV